MFEMYRKTMRTYAKMAIAIAVLMVVMFVIIFLSGDDKGMLMGMVATAILLPIEIFAIRALVSTHKAYKEDSTK